jgi:hypothetical protein
VSTVTFGTLITNGQGLLGYFTLVLIAVCGATGVWLIFSAATDMAEVSRGRRRVSAAGIFAKIAGAGACYEIPTMMGVVWGQLFSSSTAEQALGAQASGTSTATDCLTQTGTSSNPVGCIMNNIATGIVPQFVTFILVLAGVSGIWFWYRFVRAAVDKVSYGDNNYRLPWGYAVVGTLFAGVGAVTASVGSALGFASSSITAAGYAASTSYLSYIPNESSLSPQYTEMITGAYAICAALGVYEVVHGGYILAAAMNGTSQSSVGKAAGHAFFGLCLVGLPSLALAIIQSTLGTTTF